jgi:hypothetical protein
MVNTDVRRVVALGLIALAADAAAPRTAEAAPDPGSPSSCQQGFVVYFANGVQNTPDDALASLYLTHNIIGDSYNGESIVDYRRALNPTTGLSDFYRVLKQKLAENPRFTGYFIAKLLFDVAASEPIAQALLSFLSTSEQADIQNAFMGLFADLEQANGSSGGYFDSNVATHVQQYETDLAAGQKVLVVAHSQGNLYANAAYDHMVTDGVDMRAFAIASVGTAADVAKSGEYVTSTNDLVIGALRQVFPTLAANTAVTFAPLDDPLGHSYSQIYLNNAHEAYGPVVAMFNDLLGQLQANTDTQSCPNTTPDGGAADASVDGPVDAGMDTCGSSTPTTNIRDNGAAGDKYCNLLSPAEVGAAIGIPGLSGPVILQSSTDAPVAGIQVEAASCSYQTGGAAAVVISFEISTPVPGALQGILRTAESALSSAGCGVSSGDTFVASCPAVCGAPATTILGVGVKETSFLQIASGYASAAQEQTLATLIEARLP